MFKVIKKGLAMGFAPRRWLGSEQVSKQGKVCVELARELAPDTEELLAKHRSKASMQSTCRRRSRSILILCLCYFWMGLGFISYSFFLWMIKGFFLAGVVSLMISLLLLSYFVREGMLYMQIRTKRNRITVKDFLKFLFKGFSR